MTAELLGRIGAYSAFIKTRIVSIWESCLRLIPLPAPHRLFGHQERLLRQPHWGFTLMEVMIASSITGALSMMMGPSLMIMIEAQRVKSATFELYVALTTARSAAIKRNAVVTLTPHGGDYSEGYDVQSGDLLLGRVPGNAKITIKSSNGSIVAYDWYGRLTAHAPHRLEVSSNRMSGIPKHCIIFDPYGYPTATVDQNRDGDCTNG